MQITDFHATYYAYLLTRHSTESNALALAATLQDSKVDLNPHQIEAALFALRSPFSRGIIEADEVGLGKTIVAGIVIAQKWAEIKRRILVIVPANLRRQWQLELWEKFYLPSVIIDGESFDKALKVQTNPFFQNEIVITSYNFAHAKAEYIKDINWDMSVLDEAHKLRNAYKADNVMARSIQTALRDCFKLLLTATPLQNSLLELYGLVSFVDEYTFGDLDSFKAQFSSIRDEEQYAFTDLVSRLKAKLAKWSKDIKIGMERNLREIDKAIDEVNVQLRGRQLTLQKRLELQEQLAVLEPKKKELRMKIYEEQDKIDDERNRLIEETKKN